MTNIDVNSPYEPALYSGLLYLTCYINTISCCSSAVLCVHFTLVRSSPWEHNISGDKLQSMLSLGKIEEFNAASTNINYLELLEQYFAANGVPSGSSDSHKRRATLISVIGSKPLWRGSFPCTTQLGKTTVQNPSRKPATHQNTTYYYKFNKFRIHTRLLYNI